MHAYGTRQRQSRCRLAAAACQRRFTVRTFTMPAAFLRFDLFFLLRQQAWPHDTAPNRAGTTRHTHRLVLPRPFFLLSPGRFSSFWEREHKRPARTLIDWQTVEKKEAAEREREEGNLSSSALGLILSSHPGPDQVSPNQNLTGQRRRARE